MKAITAILLTLLLLTTLVLAEDKHAPSTPEERARLVDLAGKLRVDPLNPSLRSEREWALRWLIEIPDISLELCTATMPWENKYKFSGDLMSVEMTSMAAYAIEHPDKASDKIAVGQAGLEAALVAYQKMAARDSKAKSKAMDEVASIHAKGGLAAYIQQKWATLCSSKS
jgi:hypothetical protein